METDGEAHEVGGTGGQVVFVSFVEAYEKRSLLIIGRGRRLFVGLRL